MTEVPTWTPEVTFGARLRIVRHQHGERIGRPISQVEMASLLGVNKPAYSAWEAGRSKPRELVRLAQTIGEVTGADVGWVLGLTPSDLAKRPIARWLQQRASGPPRARSAALAQSS